ncbi:lipoyl(octanoyl) transferase LipB [Acetomicrobium sp.]|uniref:lipoyl(octanoyl) transferase LipB n=1 Tax=Acetomicrobium sp. TaxID=1872099 RepID=UPI00235B6577|nr:lipoyl(octanoyl) transferase LipB [Acetomicrobium sp.]
MGRRCFVVEFKEPLGYGDGLTLQERAFEKVSAGEVDGILLLLEHKPVFTIGRSGGRENLLVDERVLEAYGIELYETNRGGNITYHGPGQIVAYPIFNLSKWKKDLQWYVSCLEEVIIQVLKDYNIKAGRKPKYRGVWVADKKIAAIGIAVERWITMHGFAFNVKVDKSHFELINPCGMKEFSVASLDDYVKDIDFREVVKKVKEKFSLVFETNFKKEISEGMS